MIDIFDYPRAIYDSLLENQKYLYICQLNYFQLT